VDRRFLRPGWIVGHLLVLAAALTCLRLGWWQWERAHENDGTAQNLGYSMLWPVFAAAFIYMWIRFLRLEKIKQVEDDEQSEQVKVALGTLSPRDQEVLLLWDAGMSYPEIAEQSGLAVGAIGTTLARARRRLVEAHERQNYPEADVAHS